MKEWNVAMNFTGEGILYFKDKEIASCGDVVGQTRFIRHKVNNLKRICKALNEHNVEIMEKENDDTM